jgi:FAD/FMN-containing dehydrogenase
MGHTGMAVRYGSGLESWELFNYMARHNISVVAPGGVTVGANGGWFGSGGHGTLTSLYGLGSDQALSINVVTADGRFVTADPYTNRDLFYALRGGGAGEYH